MEKPIEKLKLTRINKGKGLRFCGVVLQVLNFMRTEEMKSIVEIRTETGKKTT